MALVKFRLQDITAFCSKDDRESSRHFCVDCACKASKQYALIPFVSNHLDLTLSQYGQDTGAAMLCDLCGRLLATYYPDDFWQPSEAGQAQG